ncbi:DUF2931 family protein [Pedobacter sp. WC2501]|uniref:DUF2931 family protein n=1 Tax=Pedobacter sp. WC2501 TaxID=3461400 RepID=UPI004046298E
MMVKYEWLPTSSAPELYPTNICNGSFALEDGKSVYIPTSGINHTGWGYAGPLHSQGEDLKALPVKLSITWTSFLEKKFYTGSWDMPIDKIKKLFEKGTIDWRGNGSAPSNYSLITVGCAPGGLVIVWVYGDDQQIEVARFQATETNLAIKDVVPSNPSLTLEEYFDVSKSVPQAYENLKKGGIQYGIWDTYRKKYDWRARIEIPNHKLINVGIEMFNGEEETLFNETVINNTFKPRAVPRLIDFIFENKSKAQTVFQIKYFDEEEIFNLFKQVDATKPIEVVLRMNEDLSNRRLVFKQEEKEFTIRKIDMENMWKYEQ